MKVFMKTILLMLIAQSVFAQSFSNITASNLTIGTNGVASGNSISITTPVQYQTFQRVAGVADIPITGTYSGGSPSAIEARFRSGAWTVIDAAPSGGTFSGTLTNQSEGQGLLSVRYADDTTTNSSKAYIGIGDIYIVAGQSNASGRGTSNQSYSHASLLAINFTNAYTWANLSDPYDSASGQVDTVSSDTSPAAAGSWIPLLATEIMADQDVPVAFVPCALGGTSISSWQPNANHLLRSTLYGSCNYRGQQIGTVKAILWWQGETDAGDAMSQSTYNAYMDTLANSYASDLGVPLIPAILQDTSYSDTDEQAIRDATTEAILDNANVLQGPDFSDLTTDDGFHIKSNAGLQTVADRWFTALQTLFY